jgi:hypothetical protein
MKVTKLEHVVSNFAEIVKRFDAGVMDLRMLRDELNELAYLTGQIVTNTNQKWAQANMIAVMNYLVQEISEHVKTDKVVTIAYVEQAEQRVAQSRR